MSVYMIHSSIICDCDIISPLDILIKTFSNINYNSESIHANDSAMIMNMGIKHFK